MTTYDATEQAYKNGYADGYAAGCKDGYDAGRKNGYEVGYRECIEVIMGSQKLCTFCGNLYCKYSNSSDAACQPRWNGVKLTGGKI